MQSINYKDFIEHKRLHDEFAETQLSKFYELVEKEAGLMFRSTLNIELEPQIINMNYAGEDFGKVFFHQLNYITSRAM